jgi:hypothetical protein
MIVATFATQDEADHYRATLRSDFGVEEHAVAMGTIGAYGAGFHGHRLVGAWIRRELEQDVRALALDGGGLLHDLPMSSVVMPRWVQDFIADRDGPA